MPKGGLRSLPSGYYLCIVSSPCLNRYLSLRKRPGDSSFDSLSDVQVTKSAELTQVYSMGIIFAIRTAEVWPRKIGISSSLDKTLRDRVVESGLILARSVQAGRQYAYAMSEKRVSDSLSSRMRHSLTISSSMVASPARPRSMRSCWSVTSISCSSLKPSVINGGEGRVTRPFQDSVWPRSLTWYHRPQYFPGVDLRWHNQQRER